MINQYTYGNTLWVDVENPKEADIVDLVREFNLDTSCAEQLSDPTLRSKIEIFDNQVFMVLHFPDHPSRKKTDDRLEIDFIIGQNYIITIRYGVIDSLIESQKIIETKSLMKKDFSIEPINVAREILATLYRNLRDEIAILGREIKNIEEEVFSGNEDKMVQRISLLRRKFIDIKHSTRFHEEVLKGLSNCTKNGYCSGDTVVVESILARYYKMYDLLEGNMEIVRELRETNDSLLTAKNNDVMKRLTLMAFITFPLSLVALVLFDPGSPHVFHGPNGFWIVVGILVILFLIMHVYFKYKKWI
jgi:magnesium transporter